MQTAVTNWQVTAAAISQTKQNFFIIRIAAFAYLSSLSIRYSESDNLCRIFLAIWRRPLCALHNLHIPSLRHWYPVFLDAHALCCGYLQRGEFCRQRRSDEQRRFPRVAAKGSRRHRDAEQLRLIAARKLFRSRKIGEWRKPTLSDKSPTPSHSRHFARMS